MTVALEHARCEIIPRADNGWIEVRVGGSMDQAGARAVEGTVRFATSDAEAGVVLDCSACRFVDSSGLRLLVESQQMAAARHIGWRLLPSGQLRELLVATGLGDVLGPPPSAG
jgi:anti-anti-sigma factor